MGTPTCHLVPGMQGSYSYRVNTYVLPIRAPHVAVGGWEGGRGGLGGEKLSVDSECPGLCWPIKTFGTSPRWVVDKRKCVI